MGMVKTGEPPAMEKARALSVWAGAAVRASRRSAARTVAGGITRITFSLRKPGILGPTRGCRAGSCAGSPPVWKYNGLL